jgi:hypothetical protein
MLPLLPIAKGCNKAKIFKTVFLCPLTSGQWQNKGTAEAGKIATGAAHQRPRYRRRETLLTRAEDCLLQSTATATYCTSSAKAKTPKTVFLCPLSAGQWQKKSPKAVHYLAHGKGNQPKTTV